MAVALFAAALPAGAAAQAGDAAGEASRQEAAAPAGGLRFDWGFEVKAHARDSEHAAVPINFPFPPEQLPPGQTRAFLETVNEGSHLELSTFTLLLDASWNGALAAHAKIDFVDLYDRNPTSTDGEVDVDEAWLRFGHDGAPAMLPERGGLYAKVGKFGKFERQDDRHLESYGLAATAFNRFEDTGVEVGVNLGRHLYLKLAATQGNPLFLRDPNALAGDNGTPVFRQPNPDPELKSGVVIHYDAEVEDLDTDGDLELGAGVGLRFADAGGRHGVDVLVWGYERTLAETVELEGTFYGGDLDMLNGPAELTPFVGLRGDEKREVGANLWLYLGGFSFFGQYVDQEVAGLPRTGFEAEAAWSFDLPLVWAVGERQVLPFVAPAVRFSRLDPDFRAHPQSPSPSFTWDWDKLDYGVRAGLVEGVDLTLEFADNTFTLASGREVSNDEMLLTLRWKR